MSVEVQVGISAGIMICLLAGIVWLHIEAIRAYERGNN